MPDRLRTLSRALLCCALVAGVFAVPSVAHASIAARAGTTLQIVANANEANNIVFTETCCAYHDRITDTAGITGVGECIQVSAKEVDCGHVENLDVDVRLGDGNDKFYEESSFVRRFNIDLGTGDDTVDHAIGPASNVIHGGPGNDTVHGGSGADQVFGDEGNDIVSGGPGADTVSGGPGRDQISGDGGLYLDGGSDTIDSRDGEVDQVTCGYGADTVSADTLDVVEGGGECESVDAVTVTVAFAVALGAKKSAKIATLLSKQGFLFAVAVNAPCRGTGKIVVAAGEARRVGLGRASITLASKTVDVPDAGTYSAGLAAATKYRAKLRTLKTLRTTLSFSCVANGVTRRKSQTVTFVH
jgi:hypothetical protein